MNAKEIIEEFHDGEWWKNDNRETFESLANGMLNKGLTPQYVYEVLSEAYCAASSEFGG